MNNARNSLQDRRGNTIVLVVGILVLLVIIATAFVVRTQAGRVTATAHGRVELAEDNVHIIADDLKQEISIALFARPINVNAFNVDPANPFLFGANWPRLTPPPNAACFLGDEQDMNGDGRLDFPYNTPPYAVVPFTNWPDPITNNDPITAFNGVNAAFWPRGLGNPNAGALAVNSPLLGEYNPLGNPGFGDTRWLRDLEPLRWDTNNDGILDAFSHWRHMTNIARPDNGYRIVFDISDVGDSNGDGYGMLVTDLNIPVEQWLAMPHSRRATGTGDTDIASMGPATFIDLWRNWFGITNGINGYFEAYATPGRIPPNLYRLRDLDADGNWLEANIGERPQDEFIANTARHTVSRVLADTDGDGYTDSFWFLAPSPVQSGVRTIVAVSVIDNQGMANPNVWGQFVRSNTSGIDRRTGGHTAADIALVAQFTNTALPVPSTVGNFHVGWYDTWENWFSSAAPNAVSFPNAVYSIDPTEFWARHLTEVGLVDTAGAPLNTPSTLERLDYWRRAASQPLSSDWTARYTPFNLSDEIELRMYQGQNYPWSLSRYEFSAGGDSADALMHSGLAQEESSEYLDQLTNRQYVRDLRHKTTLFNGVRNDIMPPWLWLYGPNKDFNGDGIINAADLDLDGDGVAFVNDMDDQALFRAGMRKFDLRLPYDFAAGPHFFVHGNFDIDRGFEFTANSTALQYGIALRDRIAASLIDAYDNLPSNRGTYFGNGQTAVPQTMELAAAYAANIAQWRDREASLPGNLASHERSPLAECIPVAPSLTNPAPNDRFMGMEPQPFLVEAFIGHIYESLTVPDFDGGGNPYANAGHNVIIDDDDRRSTVIVVQIANPYNRPIDLNDPKSPYRVRFFGQSFDLVNLPNAPVLPPASEDDPSTLILYAIKAGTTTDPSQPSDPFHDQWIDFLDINPIKDLPPNTRVVRVEGAWSVSSRSRYDTSLQPAVEIQRGDVSGPTPQWITIDRMDPARGGRRFGDAINEMVSDKPVAFPTPPDIYVQPDVATPEPYPPVTPSDIHDIGLSGEGFDYWVQWVRATRAWGVNVNDDRNYDFNEMSPRYVFGDYAVIEPGGDPVTGGDVSSPATFIYGGNRYNSNSRPDTPWFTRPYTRENPALAGQNQVVDRKPTFFDLAHGALPPAPAPAPGDGDPAWPKWSFPNKGWYAQAGPGTADDAVIIYTTDPSGPPPPAGGGPGNAGVRTYRTPFAFQMLHKDGDFEQVGELLNVFLYGHKLKFTDNTAAGTFTGDTVTTFSEYLSAEFAQITGSSDVDLRYRVNRLMTSPLNTTAGQGVGAYIGVGDPNTLDDPRHGVPDLPAGARLLEGFVCDGWGIDPLTDIAGPPPNSTTPDGAIDLYDAQARVLYNAKNFDGSATPGQINLNTAPQEVTRCGPDMMRLVHETGGSAAAPYYNYAGQPLVTQVQNANAADPRVMVPEAIGQYREKFNGNDPSFPTTSSAPSTGIPFGPNYEQRPNARGFATIGELLNLNKDAEYRFGYVDRATSNATDRIYDEQWRIDMGVTIPQPMNAALPPKPFMDGSGSAAGQVSVRLSTDRQDVWNPFPATPNDITRPDYIAGDAEEANMLFAGISNLVTTRSDMFTVYFKVRTFRQNTSVSPPRWDATNKDYIIDDSRYVMLVDRSGVNKSGDQPKILYLEKLPN